jgi:hypothetical protein
MNATCYTRLPTPRNFKLMDIAKNDEDGLKLWPIIACAALFAAGSYIVLRTVEGTLSIAWFIGIQAVIYSFAYVMYRVQSRGAVWWNVNQTRRGFRVVLKPKDKR